MGGSDPRALALAKSLSDPCNAPLEPGCYPGQIGFVQRLSNTFTITLGASDTAFVLGVTPSHGISTQSTAVAATTTLAPTFLNTFFPGGPFLVANARCMRALGGCIEFFTNAPVTSAQGTFLYGVGPHSLLANGAVSIGAVGAALQYMNKANTQAYEVKFRPGAFDQQYHRTNVNVSDDVWDDVNSMIVCGTGFPVNSSITVKVTVIVEYLPLSNLGLAMPAAANPSNVNPTAVVAALDASNPNWWAGQVGNVASLMWNNYGKGALNTALNGVARVAMKTLPLLL